MSLKNDYIENFDKKIEAFIEVPRHLVSIYTGTKSTPNDKKPKKVK
jgi:hypothetical protein